MGRPFHMVELTMEEVNTRLAPVNMEVVLASRMERKVAYACFELREKRPEANEPICSASAMDDLLNDARRELGARFFKQNNLDVLIKIANEDD